MSSTDRDKPLQEVYADRIKRGKLENKEKYNQSKKKQLQLLREAIE